MQAFSPKSKPDTQQVHHVRKRLLSRDRSPAGAAASRALTFVDRRPEAVAQRRLQTLIARSPRVQPLAQLQARIDNSPRQAASFENRTGMPDHLKAGIEHLSGVSMGDVNVHYNSAEPARLQASAYTQGTDIYVGPGQERHLPHEAWHVVQQKQHRVTATMQAKGVPINDDEGLEREADVMGEKALGMVSTDTVGAHRKAPRSSFLSTVPAGRSEPVQRKIIFTETGETFEGSDPMPFLMAYGLKATDIVNQMVPWLTDGEDHTFANFEAAARSLGASSSEKPKPEVISKTIVSVNGTIGDAPELEADQTLSLLKSKKQSSHALYELEILGKSYMLKKEPGDKSGFAGMSEMARQGLEVPPSASLTLDDGHDYVLMGRIKHLREGLAFVNQLKTDKEVLKAGYQLGIMHVTDVSVANVDRLPWRGNNHQGHLFNVFQNAFTGNVMGLDTEAPREITEQMRKDIAAELKEMRTKTHDYARGMGILLVSGTDRNKLTLEPEQLTMFANGFELGLEDGLKKLR